MKRISVIATRPVAEALLTSCGIQIALVLSGILVARALGVNDRGYFALLTLVPVIAVQIGGLGLPAGLTYFLARGSDAQASWRAVRRTAVLQTVFAVTVSWFAFSLLTKDAPSRVQTAMLVSLLLIPAGLMLNYGVALLQGLRQVRSLNFVRVLPATVNACGIAAVFILGQDQSSGSCSFGLAHPCWLASGRSSREYPLLIRASPVIPKGMAMAN